MSKSNFPGSKPEGMKIRLGRQSCGSASAQLHPYCEITICDVLLMLIVRDGTNGTEKGKL